MSSARLRSMILWLTLSVVALLALWLLATQPFVEARPWHGQSASPDRLERHVRALVGPGPGRGDDPVALAHAAAYIHAQLGAHGRPEYQDFQVSGVPYRNVLLRFDRGARRTVTVGAHYDTYGGLPGADDNASGVAGLLELARLVSDDAPDLNVEIVAYALEEPPYFGTPDMGSWHHARAADSDLTIVLEMIGYFRDEPGSQSYPVPLMRHLYSDAGNFIAVVGRVREIAAVRAVKGAFLGAGDLPIHSLTFPPVLPGVTWSDHINYWARGRKAVMITDTAYERNPHYHTRHDTPDTLDYRRMAGVVTGVYASLFALASNNEE